MNEYTRNMLGFTIAPVILGFGLIVAVCRARKRRPSFWRVSGILAGLAACGFGVWFVAGLIELPLAYAFTLLRMSGAKSANGVPVSKITKGEFAYWTTDDYFAGKCGDHDNLVTMRLEVLYEGLDYYFAYDSRTRVVVPMTDAAAKRFPALMPAGDKLVNACELNGETNTSFWMGNNELKMPAKWFRAATRTATEPGQK